jgi:hypothetical protein
MMKVAMDLVIVLTPQPDQSGVSFVLWIIL